MFMGFILYIIIIFGTNILTGGPTRIAVFFCLFQYFKEKEYQTESKWNETFGSDPFGTNTIQETWSGRQAAKRGGHEGGRRAHPYRARPPISWAPRAATDLLLPPIYTHVARKHPGSQRKTISTAVTFCIREIPSWSLRRRSAGGESAMEGFYINTIAPLMSCE